MSSEISFYSWVMICYWLLGKSKVDSRKESRMWPNSRAFLYTVYSRALIIPSGIRLIIWYLAVFGQTSWFLAGISSGTGESSTVYFIMSSYLVKHHCPLSRSAQNEALVLLSLVPETIPVFTCGHAVVRFFSVKVSRSNDHPNFPNGTKNAPPIAPAGPLGLDLV